MPSPEVTRRTVLFVCATFLLIALLYVGGGRPIAPDTLPARLTDKEFWKMVTDFSEAGGYFRSDNFLSNETGYQAVIPLLRKTIQPGGVYMGVGPEQNFTYLIAVEPKMAFVVDIRRQNMLEHLLYKALMEMSADRAEFLSRLFSRPQPAVLNPGSSADTLVQEYRNAESNKDMFESNLQLALDHLEKKKGFELSKEDERVLLKVYRAFFDSGPNLSYTFLGGYGGFMSMPTYGDLMTENDGHTHNWNFLATEDQYRAVRRLQINNLIIPLVGDFAGPTAIRSVAEYLKRHGAVLTVFYTSNVEQYLFQDDNSWNSFYANVSTLPLDSSSTFIRYVLSRGFNRRSRTTVSSMMDVVGAYARGRINGYYDIVEMSR
jgi:hypothetical protein